jgi:hypothetical protein
MAKDQDLLQRHEQMFGRAKKRGEEDPRKARYAKLVARTAQKYEEIAKARGVSIKPAKKEATKK